VKGLAFEALNENGLSDPELGCVVREGLAVDVGQLRQKVVEEGTRLITNTAEDMEGDGKEGVVDLEEPGLVTAVLADFS
jgi:hypothetical protein